MPKIMRIPTSERPRNDGSGLFTSLTSLFTQTMVPQNSEPQGAIRTLVSPDWLSQVPVGSAADAIADSIVKAMALRSALHIVSSTSRQLAHSHSVVNQA